MICISPIAPFGETSRTLPSLSARITARIHDAGTPKRCAASAMYSAKRSPLGVRGDTAFGDAVSAFATVASIATPIIITAAAHADDPRRRDELAKRLAPGNQAGKEK